MVGLSREWLDVLSSTRANFQNFLVKTRTLVCGTCVGIGRLHYGISENIYDWVIIDEAARSSASELAIAMQVGRRILLVGDHMQLPPMYEEDHLKAVNRKLPKVSEAEISISDFERCFLSPYGKEVGQTLPYQYRMAPAIGGMVSCCFYHNMLKTKRDKPISWVQNLPPYLGRTVTWIDTASIGSRSYEQQSIGSRWQSPSKMNEHEISVVLQLVAKIIESDSFVDLMENRHEPPIGIICMYDKQRSEMLKKFNQADWSRALLEKQLVKIDTVDGYQGKENSIIIVSLVRNNKQQQIGFLAEQFPAATKRTNVAISRAKERLYLVGASRMFTEPNENSALGKVYSYIQSHSLEDDDFVILNSNEITGV
jgi:superfamily I DNA and/or RNA helicase